MIHFKQNRSNGIPSCPLSFRSIYRLCALIMGISVAASLLLIFASASIETEKHRILIIGIICMAILFLIIFCLYFLIIRPISQLEQVLSGVIQNDPALLITDLSHSPLLSTIFSDLQVVIDRMKTLILRESNAQLMKKQAELDALQSQINPHFLYNTLDTIRGQAHLAGQDNIEAMALALSKLFRYSISNYSDLVTFEEELNAIGNYFLIQNFRFGNKFSLQYQIDPDTYQHKVPKMLIQPLVENAVRHGLEPKRGSGTIIIQAYKTEDRLVINVDDDGVGIEPARLTEINDMLGSSTNPVIKKKTGTSIGLYNINSRIRLLFGNDHHISVSSTEGVGTNIHISIPLL